MAWIRRTDEPPERRPVDLVRLVVGIVGVAIAGLWAQAESSLDSNIFETVNDFPNGLEGVADTLYALGSIFAGRGCRDRAPAVPEGSGRVARRARRRARVGRGRAPARDRRPAERHGARRHGADGRRTGLPRDERRRDHRARARARPVRRQAPAPRVLPPRGPDRARVDVPRHGIHVGRRRRLVPRVRGGRRGAGALRCTGRATDPRGGARRH